ncbi:energy transducer TonB [Shewanella spartinae]|uniref:energy transducer TonB n=1 Tax=Shewanella spartinae TaxID=2864205 RepID=UPI001C65544A|nr:energy transducer TonB [Shewanella spartinae]QYJ93578.1 energy transducer TonB [Shewanella spartinae]
MKETALFKRTFIAILGGVITLSLFAFMAKLIDNERPTQTYAIATPDLNLSFEPKPPEEKQRDTIIEPQQEPLQPPRRVESFEESETSETGVLPGVIEMPKVVNTTQDSRVVNDTSDALPIIQVSPQYPVSAAQEGKEGYVLLEFDISASGAVENIKVIQARPKRIFDRAAINALKKWKYKPKMEEGRVTPQTKQQVRLDFKLDQQI